MMHRKSFIPVSWVAGRKTPCPEDVKCRTEFIRTGKSRAKQRVYEEFPPVKLSVK